MAFFFVLNGTGINGAGIQFGNLSSIGPVTGFLGGGTPTTISAVLGPASGELAFYGADLSLTPPFAIGGTATALVLSKPQFTPIFAITGMNLPVVIAAQLVDSSQQEVGVLTAIFSGDDVIVGSTVSDLLFGFDGNDTVNGGGGDDALFGGRGADFIVGGEGFDFARYDFSTAGVHIDLGGFAPGSGGEAEGDGFLFIEGLVGSQFADNLTGSLIDNQLWGLGGNDILSGGGGIDFLVGGAGVDNFFFDIADVKQDEFDFVLDFTDGEDVIVLFAWQPAAALSFESNGHVFITSSEFGFTGGVAVLNATLAQVQDQILFA